MSGEYRLASLTRSLPVFALDAWPVPFGPLDPYSQEYLAHYLREMADSGLTIMASTHVLPDSGVPHRVILLDQGEVIEDLPWNEVRDRYSGVPQSMVAVRLLRDALAARRRSS